MENYTMDKTERSQLITCQICGRSILEKEAIIEVNEDDVKLICFNCSSLNGTCYRCRYALKCEFDDAIDTLPHFVCAQNNKGHVIITSDIPNPERIEKYCKVCRCWDDEYGCFKQGNRNSIPTCRNYIERE